MIPGFNVEGAGRNKIKGGFPVIFHIIGVTAGEYVFLNYIIRGCKLQPRIGNQGLSVRRNHGYCYTAGALQHKVDGNGFTVIGQGPAFVGTLGIKNIPGNDAESPGENVIYLQVAVFVGGIGAVHTSKPDIITGFKFKHGVSEGHIRHGADGILINNINVNLSFTPQLDISGGDLQRFDHGIGNPGIPALYYRHLINTGNKIIHVVLTIGIGAGSGHHHIVAVTYQDIHIGQGRPVHIFNEPGNTAFLLDGKNQVDSSFLALVIQGCRSAGLLKGIFIICLDRICTHGYIHQ